MRGKSKHSVAGSNWPKRLTRRRRSVTVDKRRVVFSEEQETFPADLFPCCGVCFEVGE